MPIVVIFKGGAVPLADIIDKKREWQRDKEEDLGETERTNVGMDNLNIVHLKRLFANKNDGEEKTSPLSLTGFL
jgi:hypothetical protein